MQTVTPDFKDTKDYSLSYSVTRVHFKRPFGSRSPDGETLYISKRPQYKSETSLVAEEQSKLHRRTAYKGISKEKHFIVDFLYDILDTINLNPSLNEASSSLDDDESASLIIRQYGQERIKSQAEENQSPGESQEYLSIDLHEEEEIFSEIKRNVNQYLDKTLDQIQSERLITPFSEESFVSVLNITPDLQEMLNKKKIEQKQEEVSEKIEVADDNKREEKRETEDPGTSSALVNEQKEEVKPKKKEKQD